MLPVDLAKEVQQLRNEIFNLTYSQVEEKKSKLLTLQSSASKELEKASQNKNTEEINVFQNIKDALDGLIMIAEAVQKEIEHQIWVQSRTATEKIAEKLVHQIPDQIILNLSKAPQHNGLPRMLLQTEAFKNRLQKLV